MSEIRIFRQPHLLTSTDKNEAAAVAIDEFRSSGRCDRHFPAAFSIAVTALEPRLVRAVVSCKHLDLSGTEDPSLARRAGARRAVQDGTVG